MEGTLTKKSSKSPILVFLYEVEWSRSTETSNGRRRKLLSETSLTGTLSRRCLRPNNHLLHRGDDIPWRPTKLDLLSVFIVVVFLRWINDSKIYLKGRSFSCTVRNLIKGVIRHIYICCISVCNVPQNFFDQSHELIWSSQGTSVEDGFC